MKRITILLVVSMIIATSHAQEFEGIEKGDMELSFYGFALTDFDGGMATVFISFGAYVTDKWLIGIAPGIIIPDSFEDTQLSAQLFTNYNFSSTWRTFPYVRLAFYQMSFFDDDIDFIDMSYAQGGVGLKSFLTERLAWDTSLQYGTLVTEPETGMLMLMTGLAFTF